jgi:hypothetical protein
MDRRTALSDALEEAALAGAREITSFLGTYRGKDPERFRRVQIAAGAVSGYTRYRASQNNMVSMMLMAARQTNVSAEQTLEICKIAGLLPTTAASVPPMKIAK